MALKNIWTLIRNVKCQHFPVLATYNCVRLLSISSLRFLKESRSFIHRTETSNQIVIEGVKVKSDREGKVINLANRSGCPLCRVGLKNLKHTVSYQKNLGHHFLETGKNTIHILKNSNLFPISNNKNVYLDD
ncbi:uncharacterized protein LOC118201291 isoform X3 [Stegodyphus dumicola]|uniref:uncharacterized protein LOC118201291 isoform X3 n=1 Tax=Stegodyphus dumicola TaxID=202533 RepID=UPI0015A7BE48|nr:uncharacterized protein LOC118201291 isoform X3 [Stegodyphus dumicola]